MPYNGNDHQSGNIFFTLFGAIALVGVIGAATTTLVRGPLSTVSAVNMKAKVDTQLAIASKLATIAATQVPGGGNCDSGTGDTYMDPLHPSSGAPAPVGGGQLPTSVGAAQVDPWGTPLGYCVWDLGGATQVGDPGCDPAGGEEAYLAGGDNPTQPVFVIMSAGPDRVFQTSCEAWASDVGDVGPPSNAATLVNKPASSDDIIAALSYQEAQSAADGLWSIMTGDPSTITTDKNVAFSSGVAFASGTTATFQGTAQFAANSKLDLGFGAGQAGLFLLPDDTELLDAECTAANNGVLRINITDFLPNTVLEMCDASLPGTFQPLGGAGVTVSNLDDLGDASAGGDYLFLGSGAGAVYDSGSGLNNLGVGIGAASNLVSGQDNIVIGNGATTFGAGTTDSIVIGHGITGGGNNTLQIGGFISGSGLYTSAGTLDISGSIEANLFRFDSNLYIDDSAGGMVLATGGASRVTIDGSGNVSIASSGGVELTVNGDVSVTGDTESDQFIATGGGAAGTPGFTFDGYTSSGLFYNSGAGLGFTIGGTSEMELDAGGLKVHGTGIFDDYGTFAGYVQGDNFQFNGSTNSGLFFTSGAGVGLSYMGDTGVFVGLGGQVGIGGETSPDVDLDVAGAIRPGYIPDSCAAPFHGAVIYTSDSLQLCSTTNAWVTVGTSGGGGGGTGSRWSIVSGSDPRIYYNTDFVGVGTADPLDDFHVGGDLLVTGSYTATPGVAVSGAGARLLFDPEGSAFRAGGVTGTQWDSANVGGYSNAMGLDVMASGLASNAFGRDVSATGSYTFGYGLGDASGVNPIVSGASSYGIFMGDQSGVNLNTANVMLLAGGSLVIDPDTTSATNIAPSRAGLNIDVEGDIGAIQYCDEDGNNCFTPAAVASGSVGVPGFDREIIYNSNGTLWTTTGFVFSSTGFLGIGNASPEASLDIGGTGAILLPRGVTGDRPAGINGMLRYNSASGKFEGYQGGGWYDIITNGGGGLGIDDLNDAIAFYASGNMHFGQGSGDNLTTGTANTSVGVNALSVVTSGDGNSGFGADTLQAVTGGDHNAALGFSALNAVSSGIGNIGIGAGAGDQITTGSNNIIIGYGQDAANNTGSNQLNIGGVLTGDLVTGNMAFNGTAALRLPGGTTAERPASGENGMLRYNSQTGKFEAYQAGAWEDIITGAAITSFLNLTDTPASYAGASKQFLRVNTAENAVEFTDELFETVSAGAAPFADFDDLDDVVLPTPNDGDVVSYDSASGTWINTPIGSLVAGAAAPDRGIQFNSGGSFAASSNFTWDATNNLNVLGTSTFGAANATDGTITVAGHINVVPNGSGESLINVTNSNDTGYSALELYNSDVGGQNWQIGTGGNNNSGGGGSSITEGNLLFWNKTTDNIRMAIAKTTGNVAIGDQLPQAKLDVQGTDAILLPRGVNGNRPASPINGMLRYNSQTGKFEGYQAGSWQDIVTGAAISTFLSLTDTPASYAASGGMFVKVNAGATALEFTDTVVNTVSGQPAPTGLLLDDLGDVDLTVAPTDGQILQYDSASGTWQAASGGSIAMAIDDLTDAKTDYGPGHNLFMGNNAGNAIGAGVGNTVIGEDAGDAMTDGNYNTALGWMALGATTTGFENVAIGESALISNIGGAQNVAVGTNALNDNTVGLYNTSVGYQALRANVGGYHSTAVGYDAMRYANDAAAPFVTYNTAIGSFALQGSATAANNTGVSNTAVGHGSLRNNTTGTYNVAVGVESLEGNTTGNWNTAVGNISLSSNTTGEANTAFGHSSLDTNTTGARNTAMGMGALASNVALHENTAVGYYAMLNADSTTTGANSYNTAVGAYALRGSATAANNTGTHNTAVGHSALMSNTSGSENFAFGSQVMTSNTTGWYNVAIGTGALASNVSGGSNTAIGRSALNANISGIENIAIGRNSGLLLTGSENTILGTYAGNNITTGTRNLVLGYDADTPAATTSNWLNIGNSITGDMATGNLSIAGTAALTLPRGATADRPASGVNGMLRYNSQSGKFEGYQAGSWQDLLTGAATSSFVSLTDTPASYAGSGTMFVRVNTAENALEFTDEIVESVTGQPAPEYLGLNDLSDVDLTVAPTDGQVLRYDSAAGMWIAGLGGGAASGPDRSLQFNSGGSFAGDGNLVYTSAGWLGLGLSVPDVMLDIAGEARIGNTALACAGTVTGALRYNSGNGRLEMCDGATWRALVADTLVIDLVVSPSTVNNMDVTGCGTPPCNGAPVIFTVQNQGASTSAVMTTSVSNTTNFAITSDTCNGNTLAAGLSCQVTVTPRSSGNESFTGLLNIAANNNPFAIMQGTSSGFGCSPGVVGAGGVYVACGLNDGDGAYDLIVMPGGCDGTTLNPTCSGTDGATVQKTWGPSGTIPSVCSPNNFACKNAQNAVNIIAAQAVGMGAFAAASYCDSMSYNGKNDWYLPNQYEMESLLYPEKNAGNLTGFVNNRYWTSHIYDPDYSMATDMTNGTSGGYVRGSSSYHTRCVRRENLPLPSATADTDPDNSTTGFKIRVTETSGQRLTSVESITIAGILQPATISVSGASGNPMITINGGAEVSSGAANWGDVIRVVMDAPTVAGSMNTATISLGPDNYTYNVAYADPAKESRIFVTDADFVSNLGGLGGADSKCTNAANAAAIGGSWVALLSDSSSAALNRTPWNWGVLKRLDGVVVADNWADLWDGTIQNPINITENMTTEGKNVFTNTATSGAVYSTSLTHCQNWTNTYGGSGDDGRTGTSAGVGATWLNSSEVSCGGSAALYCVESVAGGLPPGSPAVGLDDLSDVDLTTTPPGEGQTIVYNSASGLWVPGASTAAIDFLGLTDTPGSYAGTGGQFVKVNTGENALEFTDEMIETVTGQPVPASSLLDDLGDVDLTVAPTDGQALVYDSASGFWIPGAGGGGGGGSTTFLALTDTPASFAGSGGMFLKVNAGATAVEFANTLVNTVSGGVAPTGMVLDDLDDVVITTVANGDFLIHNGTNWINPDNISWNGTTFAITGNITYTGTLHDVSDMRLKTDIHPLRDRGSMLEKFARIDTYSFRMKDNPQGGVEFGVMAQEINRVFPELVAVNKNKAEHYMSVNYVGLIAPLIEASKELKAENDALKAELATIQTAMADIQGDIRGLKAHTGYGISKAAIGFGMMIGMAAAAGLGALFLSVAAFRRQRRQAAGQHTTIE